jgi:hypothetical protein
MSPLDNPASPSQAPVSGAPPSGGLIQEWRSLAGTERLEVVALCAAFVVVFWLVVLFAGFSPLG